jgi:hypothetical protein
MSQSSDYVVVCFHRHPPPRTTRRHHRTCSAAWSGTRCSRHRTRIWPSVFSQSPRYSRFQRRLRHARSPGGATVYPQYRLKPPAFRPGKLCLKAPSADSGFDWDSGRRSQNRSLCRPVLRHGMLYMIDPRLDLGVEIPTRGIKYKNTPRAERKLGKHPN